MEEFAPPKNWWQRNWKWALPTGGCLVVLTLIIIFVVTLVGGVSTLFKESAPYQTAVNKAKESSWVIERLGEPIETTGIAQGNINLSNGSGEADLQIPIKGPKDEAVIMVWGTKNGGEWSYKYIRISIDDSGEVYDLINNRLLQSKNN